MHRIIIIMYLCVLRRYGIWGKGWKACGRAEVQLDLMLTSALDGGEWSASRPGRLHPKKEPPVPNK
jgi:hypothetical protein